MPVLKYVWYSNHLYLRNQNGKIMDLKKQIKCKEKKNKRNVEMNLIFKLIVGSKC